MPCELHVVDAFTRSAFRGNPAAVCILDGPADPSWMQEVAAELKHSETAFVHPTSGGWNLRWFTPEQEVDLCGHATLASAFVLWKTNRVPQGSPVTFETLSGKLSARQEEGWINLDFPATPANAVPPIPGSRQGSGLDPSLCRQEPFRCTCGASHCIRCLRL